MGCVYKYPCLQVFVEYTDDGDTGNAFIGDSLQHNDLTGIIQNDDNEENNTNALGNFIKSNSDTQTNNKGNEMLEGNPHIPGIGTKISNIPGRNTLGNISSSNIQHSTINGVYSNRTVEAHDNITSNNNKPIINTKQTGQTISPTSKSPSNGFSDNELSENRVTDNKLSVIGLVDNGLSEKRLSDSGLPGNRLSEKGLPRQYLAYDPHRNSKRIAERLTEKYPAPSNQSNTSSKYSLLYRRWGDSFYNTVSVTVQKSHYPPANHHAIHRC